MYECFHCLAMESFKFATARIAALRYSILSR